MTARLTYLILAGHYAAPPSDRVNIEWPTGTEKPGPLSVQFYRHCSTANVWKCDVKSASCAAKRSSLTERIDGIAARL